MLICLLTWVAVNQPGRNVGRRMEVYAVELQSNRSCNHRIRRHNPHTRTISANVNHVYLQCTITKPLMLCIRYGTFLKRYLTRELRFLERAGSKLL